MKCPNATGFLCNFAPSSPAFSSHRFFVIISHHWVAAKLRKSEVVTSRRWEKACFFILSCFVTVVCENAGSVLLLWQKFNFFCFQSSFKFECVFLFFQIYLECYKIFKQNFLKIFLFFLCCGRNSNFYIINQVLTFKYIYKNNN